MNLVDSRRARLASALLTVLIGGCGLNSSEVDTLPRVPVSGRVTLDGTPLPEGKIQFQPTNADSGIMAVGEIKDGAFAIDQAKGPVPGNYRILISSQPVVVVKQDENPGSRPSKREPEKVASEFSSKASKLAAEVKADGPNSFEFAVAKKTK